VTEKMKGRTAREGKYCQDKPLMRNILNITTKEDEELSGLYRRGRGMIKTCRTEKRAGLFPYSFAYG